MTGFRPVVGIDVDEVLAALHAPWIEWINRTYLKHAVWLDPEGGFPSWDWPTEQFGQSVYDFLRPEIYDNDIVQPIPGAKEAVHWLRQAGWRIAFVSSCHDALVAVAKGSWLVRHGFLSSLGWSEDSFYALRDKNKAPVHMLVDDGYHNVETFRRGPAFLVTRPHNTQFSWPLRITNLSALTPSIVNAA